MRPIEQEKIGKILIRGTNWVGDAVMSIPAMREVRRIFPQAHITLLVRPWVRDVYGDVEFVDAVMVYDKQGVHRGPRGLLRLAASLKQRRFDLALLLQNAFEAALIAWSARIPLRVGYARDARGFLLTHPLQIDPELRSVHQVHYYLGILYAAGWLPQRPWKSGEHPINIRIGVRDADRRAADALLRAEGVREDRPLLVINPGAHYGGAKRWFPERYAAVAEALAQRYALCPVLVGSAREIGIAREIARRMKSAPVVLSGRTSLGQLMAVIERCRLFITNDSGPMHLAAALDVPQVAVFGSTSEVATGPWSRKAEVIRHPVDCSPCFLRECPTDLACMAGVTVEQVLAAAERKLAEGWEEQRDRGPRPGPSY